MVSKIHDNVHVVLGVNGFIELEAEICLRGLTFKFLNRSVPVFPVHKEMVKPKEWRFMGVEAKFPDEIQGLVITKLLGLNTNDIMVNKVFKMYMSHKQCSIWSNLYILEDTVSCSHQ